MVGDFAGYKAQFRPEDDGVAAITEAGSLAYLRRNFANLFELYVSPGAAEALVYTG